MPDSNDSIAHKSVADNTIFKKIVEIMNDVWFMHNLHTTIRAFANRGDMKADLEEAKKKIIKLKEKNSALKARITQLETRISAQFL
ncbi:hypothetical protein BCIN_13g01230 [Botrytis cinerea B05.10]|uniref:Uncharacterized protein n=1 Tax=Botryotinia fuckeliana (strain B05.10) TaxID=332648 RepID=A0A384K167_BOTFB|nr:hypothetical protein BCIN_13g01230 [Botrytis cinerea B05.10]ATZ56277.1 hypothetical protein BCIN_13g01230 [Botrytis cinerea B05.10]